MRVALGPWLVEIVHTCLNPSTVNNARLLARLPSLARTRPLFDICRVNCHKSRKYDVNDSIRVMRPAALYTLDARNLRKRTASRLLQPPYLHDDAIS